MKTSGKGLLRTVALALSALATGAAAWSLADAALVSAGIGAAGASMAFAGLMVAQGAREPRVNGLEYLAIFAQPNGAPKPDAAAPPPRLAAQEIDQTPTGSIAKAESIAPLPDDGFHIIAGRRDLIWMRNGQTIRAVRPGDDVAGLGLVGAIAQRGGRWVLLDPAGAVLLTNEAPAEARQEPAAKRFSKSLIFD